MKGWREKREGELWLLFNSFLKIGGNVDLTGVFTIFFFFLAEDSGSVADTLVVVHSMPLKSAGPYKHTVHTETHKIMYIIELTKYLLDSVGMILLPCHFCFLET